MPINKAIKYYLMPPYPGFKLSGCSHKMILWLKRLKGVFSFLSYTHYPGTSVNAKPRRVLSSSVFTCSGNDRNLRRRGPGSPMSS